MTRFRRLAFTTAVAVIVLVAVGGLVRATGSGLGCLDEWPTCRGGWTAPADWAGVIEYSHRAIAGVVVLLVAAQAVLARRWVPERRSLARLSLAAVVVVVAQAALGRVVVIENLHAAWVTAHLVLAMVLIALTTGVSAAARVADRPLATGDERKAYRLGIGAMAGIALLLVAGAYVREKGAGLAFTDWPLMDGSLVPNLATLHPQIHFAHRLLALLVGGHVLGLVVAARGDGRADVRTAAHAVGALYLVQVAVGAANVFSRLAPLAVLAHVAFGGLVWASAVAYTVVARRAGTPGAAVASATEHGVTDAGGRDHPPAGLLRSVGAYWRLTKPRIILLLLVTTVPAMMLAEGGWPSTWLVLATLAGGMMTAGSANAINQYLERDIDGKMSRTRDRPLPSHSVSPARALVFGAALGVVGFAWLSATVNLLSAWLAASAIVFYVLVYTVLLKRNTPQNIVIGGAAGAVPVLVGWAAVTGRVEAPAWILFAIIFLWTPPHFWALAMRYRDDYAAAGIPMLPVVRGTASTTRQILAYTLVLVAVTLALYPVAPMGLVYLAPAVGLGVGFVHLAVRLRRDPTAGTAMRLFKYSISYLALLFAAVAADSLVGTATRL